MHNLSCRLRAVPLQSVKSKLGRTGESELAEFARFARFSCLRFPRSRDHPKGLLAVHLSCENEFYLHENEKSFPYQRLRT